MEDLNNRQIVLLSMFVSFVVSIATGIITVAMLEEAPQTVTQTVNRVVERTIERVVPGEMAPSKAAPVTTTIKEVTVFAKEDDLLVAAVEKNQPRMVKIWETGAATSTPPRAIGFVVSRDGLIAAEARTLFGDTAPKASYVVSVGGKEYVATAMQAEVSSPVAFIRITNLPEKAMLDAVTFGSNITPKLAQTIIVLGGTDGTSVMKTGIARIRMGRADSSTSSPEVAVAIETAPEIPGGNAGGLAVNLDGQAVGIVVLSNDSTAHHIYPIARILERVSSVNSSATERPVVEAKDQSAAASAADI